MEILTLDLPAMYGDHHVPRVRGLLTALPGVQAVNASSAMQRVVVNFDPAQTSAEAIRAALAAGGYPPGQGVDPDTLHVPEAELAHMAAYAKGEPGGRSLPEPPPSLGTCPGLEPQAVRGEHPADR